MQIACYVGMNSTFRIVYWRSCAPWRCFRSHRFLRFRNGINIESSPRLQRCRAHHHLLTTKSNSLCAIEGRLLRFFNRVWRTSRTNLLHCKHEFEQGKCIESYLFVHFKQVLIVSETTYSSDDIHNWFCFCLSAVHIIIALATLQTKGA